MIALVEDILVHFAYLKSSRMHIYLLIYPILYLPA